ncbi:MAG: flippase [Actinobacteria bacterium]|nr:flippase [Actinomycetota bacterium]
MIDPDVKKTDPPEAETPPLIQPDKSEIYLPRVAKGAMINLFGVFSRTVLATAYTLLLARMLSVNDLGQYFLILTIVNILGLVSTVGLDLGVVRFVSLYAGEGQVRLVRRTAAISLLIGLVIAMFVSMALILVAPFVSSTFFESGSTAVTGIRIFALSIPFWVLARLFNAITQGLHFMRYQVYSRDLGEQFAKFGLSFVALLMGLELVGVAWANVIAIAGAATMAAVFAYWAMPVENKPVEPKSEQSARRLLRYSLPLAFSNVLGMVLTWIDLLLLGYLGTPTEVGFYGAALRVGVISAAILIAFSTVFAPVIADLFNRHLTHDLQALFKTLNRWIFICSLPLIISQILFADSIMNLFGAEFSAGSEVLILLAVGQLFHATAGLSGSMLLMSGHSKLELINIMVTLAVNVGLCYLLIPSFGILGAGMANILAAGLINFMRSLEVWMLMRIHAYDRDYTKPVLACITSTILMASLQYYIFGGKTLGQLALLASGLIIIYVLVTITMGLNSKDKAILRLIKARLMTVGAGG